MGTLAQYDVPSAGPNANSSARDSFFFVVEKPDGTATVCRLNAATLVLDVKETVGIGQTTNTAYGPTTNDAVREYLRAGGFSDSSIPKVSTEWRGAEALPASVLRWLAWIAYGETYGVTVDGIVLDRVAAPLRWGSPAPGARVEVVCAPVARRAVRETETPGASSGGSSGASSWRTVAGWTVAVVATAGAVAALREAGRRGGAAKLGALKDRAVERVTVWNASRNARVLEPRAPEVAETARARAGDAYGRLVDAVGRGAPSEELTALSREVATAENEERRAEGEPTEKVPARAQAVLAQARRAAKPASGGRFRRVS